MPDATVTVPAAAPSTATAGLTTVSVEIGPTAAAATGAGGGVAAGSVVQPAAALATAEGGAFTADQIFEPAAAVASASGPTPTVTAPSGSITISPASAVASGSAGQPFLLSDFLCGEYGAGFYGAGFYGICSVIEMSLFATTWDLAYTTDDASDPTPTWITIDQEDVRSVDVARGRDDELGRVDAGTAQIVLNNRTRSFDPQVVSGLRPMNRWRVRAIHNAVTYDVFLGYAESYEQSWPGMGFDAVTTVRLVDEFKLLALDTLPAMNPPTAQTYADVVLFDQPQGYWRFQEEFTSDDRIMVPAAGGVSMTFETSWGRTASPIVGDAGVDHILGTPYGARSTTFRFFTIEGSEFTTTKGLPVNGPGDAAGLNTMTFEVWMKSSEATPATERYLALSPRTDGGTSAQWGLFLQTDGKLRATAVNSGGTAYNAVSNSAITANVWYHIAITVQASFTSLYVNGVLQTPQGAFSGVFDTADVGAHLQIGQDSAAGGTRYYDEPAFYRYTLESARLLAHYEAGALRGYPTQAPADRAASVVADSSSVASTSFADTIGREMIPTFQHGQSVLEELRNAEHAEQGFLFVSKNGTITMLQAGYQGIPPYNIVQATFDDDGTDLPYRDLTLDYSETFLHNEIQVSVVGGELYTDSDATSISEYGRRTLALPALPITSVGDSYAIAANLLSAYKDPIERITSMGVLLYDSVTISEVLSLDLGDRVRILRTHPGGGARIDQQAQLQKIQLSSRPGQPITVTLGVSPL
jgi:hypothetical protein